MVVIYRYFGSEAVQQIQHHAGAVVLLGLEDSAYVCWGMGGRFITLRGFEDYPRKWLQLACWQLERGEGVRTSGSNGLGLA